MAELTEEEWELWRTFHAMRQQLARALEDRFQHDAGISDPSYAVLVALVDSAERQLRSRELVVRTGWEKSRLSHQLTRMARHGLVERSDCDDDSRGTWIRVTPKGRRLMLKATRGHAAAVRALFFDPLSHEELAALRSASEKILAAINGAAGPNGAGA